MMCWIEKIKMGMDLYRMLLVFFLPAGLCLELKKDSFEPLRFAANELFFFYMSCLFALVFLPFPENLAELTYRIQPIPFYFVYDIVKNPSMGAILGVLFNILMTIPFGMYLGYVLELDTKKVLILALGLTLFIELAQLTGFFFLFPGSYRICDVDDIMTNVLGAFLGSRMVAPFLFDKKISISYTLYGKAA